MLIIMWQHTYLKYEINNYTSLLPSQEYYKTCLQEAMKKTNDDLHFFKEKEKVALEKCNELSLLQHHLQNKVRFIPEVRN